MEKLLQKYFYKFERLRIDKAHGKPAPHKPILLISVLQAFQKNLISGNRIYISPELVALFKANWGLLVTSNHDCRFALPFYHLKSDGFWTLVAKAGFENLLQLASSMRSFANLNAAIEFAVIADDLLLLMKDQKSNIILLQFLLDQYFPNHKINLKDSSYEQQKHFDDIEGMILHDSPEQYKSEIKKLMVEKNDEEIFIRGSLFKREIPKIYNYTCCISGMKIDATINVSMVDACHIVPFSESYNDTISNGIALCPNLHRAFDRGLIAIDDDYKVIISRNFREINSDYSIQKFEGKVILLPKEREYFPLRENLGWHRDKVFKF